MFSSTRAGRLEKSDVVIVGGGPVGLMVAIHARRAGMRVVVLDKATPPIDKACGEGLMPAAVRELQEVGIAMNADLGQPFEGIRYLMQEPRIDLCGHFLQGLGWGVRRTKLHAALVECAASLGADLRWGQAALGLSEEGVHTTHGLVHASWRVGADGLHSKMRRWAGLEGRTRATIRWGLRLHYRGLEPLRQVEVHWSHREGEVYLTPLTDGEIGVAWLKGRGAATMEGIAEAFPQLAERIRGATPSSTMRASGPFFQSARCPIAARLALVGDASGYVDALTGEGLSLGFLQARILVSAIARGNLTRYARQHRLASFLPSLVARALLWLRAEPKRLEAFLRTLSTRPTLFDHVVTWSHPPLALFSR